MTDIAQLFMDRQFDIKPGYTDGESAFSFRAFAEELFLLEQNGKSKLANLMNVESAPLLTGGDELLDEDEVLSVEFADGEGLEDTALVTLHQTDRRGDHKKLMINREIFERGFASIEEIAAEKVPNHDAVANGGYDILTTDEQYKDATDEIDGRRTVFSNEGEFGDSLIRLHQVDSDGKVINQSFIDRDISPELFERAAADRDSLATKGHLVIEDGDLEADGYEKVTSVEDYFAKTDMRNGSVVFTTGRYGDDIVRFHQLDGNGDTINKGYVARQDDENLFEIAELDKNSVFEHGRLADEVERD